MARLFLTVLVLFFSLIAAAQHHSRWLLITNAETGLPVAGAVVSNAQRNIFRISDESGMLVISSAFTGEDRLVIIKRDRVQDPREAGMIPLSELAEKRARRGVRSEN